MMNSFYCDLPHREPKEMVPGVSIRTFWGKEMLISFADFKRQAVVPEHQHQEEQMGVIIHGEIELTIGGETRWLKPGDSYIIPSQVTHSARAGDAPARAMDIFSPVRKDYQY